MPKYFVNGVEVDSTQALNHWHESAEYRQGTGKGVSWTWLLAERGMDERATALLLEAGVRIDPDDGLNILESKVSGAHAFQLHYLTKWP